MYSCQLSGPPEGVFTRLVVQIRPEAFMAALVVTEREYTVYLTYFLIKSRPKEAFSGVSKRNPVSCLWHLSSVLRHQEHSIVTTKIVCLFGVLVYFLSLFYCRWRLCSGSLKLWGLHMLRIWLRIHTKIRIRRKARLDLRIFSLVNHSFGFVRTISSLKGGFSALGSIERQR